jgi:hypothetical protein
MLKRKGLISLLSWLRNVTFSRMGDLFLLELKRDRYPCRRKKGSLPGTDCHHMQRLVEIYLSHEGRYIHPTKRMHPSQKGFISRAKRDISLTRKGVAPHTKLDISLTRKNFYPSHEES